MNENDLILRPLFAADQERILDILTSNLVSRTYMLPDYGTREDAIPLFLRLMELSNHSHRFVRCISLHGEPIGFLNDVEIKEDTIELGYVIHPDYQNRGFMTSALRLAIRQLFAAGYANVICGAFEENKASLRVMEKCGMTRMTHTDSIEYRGQVHHCIYCCIQKFESAITNSEIMQIALAQSAIDCNCKPEDFLRSEYVITDSQAHPQARKYLPLPFSCDMVSYGNNIVAQTHPDTAEAVREYLTSCDAGHAFEAPAIHRLDELLFPFGLKVCFMAEYFLPDLNALRPLPCSYELRILNRDDFKDLYLPQWSNALCAQRKELDVLGVGAYDQGKLVGLAGCSADCDTMYQIGVDVLPEYRRRGIAAAVTSHLALEILKLGKVPFYCAAWCNLRSVGNAIKCGFRPAWVELTARDIPFVTEMNRRNQ